MHELSFFADSNVVMFIKLLLSIVIGGIIGTERALLAHQPAGTRTFGLVALGACLFTITAHTVDSSFIGIVNFDPMHIAVGIVTGIGFIGGGLIVFRGESIHGITTAAGLWITAAIGMAIGYGLFAISIFAALLTFIMFTGMWYVEERFKHWFLQQNETAHKV